MRTPAGWTAGCDRGPAAPTAPAAAANRHRPAAPRSAGTRHAAGRDRTHRDAARRRVSPSPPTPHLPQPGCACCRPSRQRGPPPRPLLPALHRLLLRYVAIHVAAALHWHCGALPGAARHGTAQQCCPAARAPPCPGGSRRPAANVPDPPRCGRSSGKRLGGARRGGQTAVPRAGPSGKRSSCVRSQWEAGSEVWTTFPVGHRAGTATAVPTLLRPAQAQWGGRSRYKGCCLASRPLSGEAAAGVVAGRRWAGGTAPPVYRGRVLRWGSGKRRDPLCGWGGRCAAEEAALPPPHPPSLPPSPPFSVRRPVEQPPPPKRAALYPLPPTAQGRGCPSHPGWSWGGLSLGEEGFSCLRRCGGATGRRREMGAGGSPRHPHPPTPPPPRGCWWGGRSGEAGWHPCCRRDGEPAGCSTPGACCWSAASPPGADTRGPGGAAGELGLEGACARRRGKAAGAAGGGSPVHQARAADADSK